MLLFISPAKTMQRTEDVALPLAEPCFLEDAEVLAQALLDLGRDGAQKVWRCSDALAAKAWELTFVLPQGLAEPGSWSLAAMSYIGIQYQHMAPQVMDERELAWMERHLRILSGLYGVLKPQDGIVPYRLEMGAKLPAGTGRDLYQYWGGRIFDAVAKDPEADLLVNLASAEYARAIMPWAKRAHMPCLACLFGSVRPEDGRLIQRATEAKAARGTFVRWCAETKASSPEDLRAFSERGYHLDKERSDASTFVFVQGR